MVSRLMWQNIISVSNGECRATQAERRSHGECRPCQVPVISDRSPWNNWQKCGPSCASCIGWLAETDLGFLYAENIPLRLNSKVNKALISPALTDRSECWAMDVNTKRNIAITEMRMFRGILGVLRRLI